MRKGYYLAMYHHCHSAKLLRHEYMFSDFKNLAKTCSRTLNSEAEHEFREQSESNFFLNSSFILFYFYGCYIMREVAF